jgi:hypothetical protein
MEEGVEIIVREAERISKFEQYVMEELRSQRVYTTLASSSPVVASSSHVGSDGDKLYC